MNKEAHRAGAVHSEQGIGTRRRRPAESTYGLSNHEDGIQSGDLTGADSPDPAQTGQGSKEGHTAKSGPGDTDSNGMKGQT